MAGDFELIAKIKADMSELMKDIDGIPGKVGNKLKMKLDTGASGANVGKALVSGNYKMLGSLLKIGAVTAAVAAGIGLLVKSSPQLQSAIDRLTKTFLLFFKPIGDLLAKILNPLTTVLRDLQKGGFNVLDIQPGKEQENLSKTFEVLYPGFEDKMRTDLENAFKNADLQINGIPGMIETFFTNLGIGWNEFWKDDGTLDTFLTNLGTQWNLFWANLIIESAKFLTDLQTGWDTTVAWFDTNVFTPLGVAWEAYKKLQNLVWEEIDKKIREIIEPIVVWFQDNIVQPLVDKWDWFKTQAIAAWDALAAHIKNNPIIQIIKQVVQGAVDVVKKTAESIFGVQTGMSNVPNDGLYYLHRGEKVTGNTQQSGERSVTFAPSFSITLTGGGNTKSDAEQIYREVMQRMDSDLRRLL